VGHSYLGATVHLQHFCSDGPENDRLADTVGTCHIAAYATLSGGGATAAWAIGYTPGAFYLALMEGEGIVQVERWPRGVFSTVVTTLNSSISAAVLIVFCALSFYLGQLHRDMNLFASSGGLMTVFGLLSLIRFTTIEKYLNQDAIIERSSGLTGPPVPDAKASQLREKNIAAANIRIKAELRSEMKGILLTVIGTLIWAYGAYVPIF
jgi:hypothetical protein